MAHDRSRTALLGVFALALFVRILYVVSIRHAFFFDHLVTEPAFYDGWARAIIAGEAHVHLPFDEAPGFAWFVALVYAIAGHSVFAVATFASYSLSRSPLTSTRSSPH